MTNSDSDDYLNVRLPKKLKERIEKLADEQDRSTSAVVRVILIQHLQRLEIEQAVAAMRQPKADKVQVSS